jgi:uncharacterized membrane protein
VIPLDMTIEEAAKLVISAGLVTPLSKEEIAAEEARAARRKQQLARVAGAALDQGDTPPDR